MGAHHCHNLPPGVRIRMRQAWWLRPYIYGVFLFAALTGATPDKDRVLHHLRRGTVFIVEFD